MRYPIILTVLISIASPLRAAALAPSEITDPGRARALGSLSLVTGDLDEASELFRRCLELDAQAQECLRGLAQTLEEQQEIEEALETYLQILEHHPSSESARWVRRYLREDTDRWEMSDAQQNLLQPPGDHIRVTVWLGEGHVEVTVGELRKRCGGGSVEACEGLATWMQTERGPDEPAKPRKKACELGSERSCGWLLDNKIELEESVAVRVLDLFEPQCKKEAKARVFGWTCARLASVYASSDKLAERGWPIFVLVCEAGDHNICKEMIEVGERLGRDNVSAIVALAGHCGGGVEQACTILLQHEEKDPAAQLQAVERRCEVGNQARWCLQLASMLDLGTGAKKPDPKRAVSIYQRLCNEQEYARACAKLDRRVEGALGQTYDIDAVLSQTQICEPQPDLCNAAVDRFAVLHGDTGESLAAYQKACSAGVQRGCAKLGELLVYGRVVRANRPKGVAMLRTACSVDEETSCDLLEDLGEPLPELVDDTTVQ